MSSLVRQLFNKVRLFPNFQNITNNINAPLINGSIKHFSNKIEAHEVIDPKRDTVISKEVIQNINDEIAENRQGRLFAVVHVAGKQFKITTGDIIVVEGYWPPDVGDKLNLNKVLVLGAKDFSLIGRPIVQQGLVNVHATVIEKTLSHTKTHFKKKRRKQYKNIKFCRIPQTMLRINDISFNGEVNNPPDVTQVDYTVM